MIELLDFVGRALSRRAACAIAVSSCLILASSASVRADSGSTGEQRAAGGTVTSAAEPALSLQELRRLHADHPTDADIAFNLGLRYAHAGHIGRAALALERAHFAAPLDAEIDRVRTAVRDEARRQRAESAVDAVITEGEPRPLFWMRLFGLLSVETYAAILLVAVWLGFGALAFRRRAETTVRRDALAVGAIICGIVAAHAAGFWLGRQWTAAILEPGVVVGEQTRYREAPDELAPRKTDPDLYEGAVVLIEERRDEWLRVELVTGEELWLSAADVAPIFPARSNEAGARL